MTGRGDTPLNADGLVIDHPEKQGAVSWPLPVEARLERLLEQAKTAAERTSRKELVAALIATADPTDAQLRRMLRRYRTARVRDILPVPEGENVIPFVRQGPGPRTARNR
jgi:hypothetical protein